VAQRGLGFWQRFAAVLVIPVLRVLTRPTWTNQGDIPAGGGVILVPNHASQFDPLVVAHYIFAAGRWPSFLAKASLWDIPVLGPFIGKVKQIPVERGSVEAVKSLDALVAALHEGGAVVIYPEGTTTKEPGLWPMRGKTGAARLWLATGAPVIPVVMWGPERLFDPRTKKLRPIPRTPVTVIAGPPLDLSRWDGAAPTAATLHEVTEFIMLKLRDMLAGIRGGTPPPLWSGSAASPARPKQPHRSDSTTQPED
jgi:1-acyl-sn-glycerol-3-phosphate acyltransferase